MKRLVVALTVLLIFLLIPSLSFAADTNTHKEDIFSPQDNDTGDSSNDTDVNTNNSDAETEENQDTQENETPIFSIPSISINVGLKAGYRFTWKTLPPGETDPAVSWTDSLYLAVVGDNGTTFGIKGEINPLAGIKATYDLGVGFDLDYSDDMKFEYNLKFTKIDITAGIYDLIGNGMSLEFYSGVLKNINAGVFSRLNDYTYAHLQFAMNFGSFYLAPALGVSGVTGLVKDIEDSLVDNPVLDSNDLPFFYAMIPIKLSFGETFALTLGARYVFSNPDDYIFSAFDESLVLDKYGDPVRDADGNLIRNPSIDPRYDYYGIVNGELGINLKMSFFELDLGACASYGFWMNAFAATGDITIKVNAGPISLSIGGSAIYSNLKDVDSQYINGFFMIGQDFDLYYDDTEPNFVDKNGVQNYLLKQIKANFAFGFKISDTVKLGIVSDAKITLDDDGQEAIILNPFTTEDLTDTIADPFDDTIEINSYFYFKLMAFEKMAVTFKLGYDFKYEGRSGTQSFKNIPYLGIDLSLNF